MTTDPPEQSGTTQPPDLAVLRVLCEQASDGPWFARTEGDVSWLGAEAHGYTLTTIAPFYNTGTHGPKHAQNAAFAAAARNALPTLLAVIEQLTSAEGGIRDAAIAYVRAAEDDPELVEGGLYRDLVSAVDHWVAVTARLEAAAEAANRG